MFSPSYKRYVLGAVTAVYTLNLVDRGLMTLLLEPIKQDLHLSDTQLGLLTGIAFGLFYATLGLPLSRWADRGNRVTIAAASIGLWGLTVMACLFVTNYIQLLAARVAAAVGESGCKPPTYSLVGDYFTQPAERTRAMAVYITGSYLSTILAFILGGWLNESFGWRMTFFLMGIPGLLLALLVRLTVVEPRNRQNPCKESPPLPPMRQVLATLWRQQSLRHLSIALILVYTMSLGLGPWQAAFMMRTHGLGTAELGLWLGLIFSIAGIAGVLLGGYAASHWFAENERAQMRLSAVAIGCTVLPFASFLLMDQKYYALGSLIPKVLVFGVFLGPTYALMQRLVPGEMRATMMALVMLFANLIGFGIGPQIVGILSDALSPVLGKDSLRYAMLGMSFIAPWAAYHFWRVGRTIRYDLARTDPNIPETPLGTHARPMATG
jgi:predicted MFS family arabinose efflux permease